jgi:hypothetical protein
MTVSRDAAVPMRLRISFNARCAAQFDNRAPTRLLRVQLRLA